MTIEFKNISKHFGGKRVLEQFNLKIPRAEISCLLGQSGIGKTTLLNILAGIVQPDQGAVLTPEYFKVSYLFQDSLLLPWMTVQQNICYLMAERFTRAEKKNMADRLIKKMELEGFGNHYPAELSGGMARRTALARALAMEASLLIMDEPFASLDADMKSRMIATVKENTERQSQTVLLVTHDIQVAKQIGDHIFMAKKDSQGHLMVEEYSRSATTVQPQNKTAIKLPQQQENIMNNSKQYSLGCDLGSSSVKIAVLDENNNRVYSDFRMHRGDVISVFKEMMARVYDQYEQQICWAMAQGSMAKGFAKELSANEIAAVVEGAKAVFPGCRSIIDIGGESARYIADVDSEQLNFAMNSSCSAGTGSFFEDQMTRLGTTLEQYSSYVEKARSVPRIAGRCTVFAKTDIIHRQQEGATTPDILSGLAHAMVRNFKGTIIRNLPVHKPVVLSGGVVLNSGVVTALKKILNLDTVEYSEHSPCLGAIGCAILARQNRIRFDRKHFMPSFSSCLKTSLAPLSKTASTENLHPVYPLEKGQSVYLGIDIGSTSTNLVLINEMGKVVDYQYLRTGGEPLKVAQEGIEAIYRRYGHDLDIRAIGTTGSGRYMVGKAFGALVIKDEITAQAQGAKVSVPDVDTIFEIGGQDSKFIRLVDGQVNDFQMNKVCAAGTGSFVEEQATRLDISLDEFGPLAFKGTAPCELGERCTVFIKSQLEKTLSEGADKGSVAAGICYSIVHNYLHKVVGNKNVGQRICLSGGVACNEGIVSAFRQYYPRLTVTPYFSVTGAYGIALIVKDEAEKDKTPERSAANQERIEKNIRLYHKAEKYFYGSYCGKIDPQKKTIGIPRALMIYKMFPMAYNYFSQLGYNVLLSPKTDEDIIQRSQELVVEETCYPVKLILGHFSWLMEQGCDAIFIPSVYTMRHEASHLNNNYGCVFMQNVAARYAKLLRLEEKGIQFLNPVLEMDMGAPELTKAMISIGQRLGHPPEQCTPAMAHGGRALQEFNTQSEIIGKQILDGVCPDERVLVLITRTYGLDDAVLSMGIADQLLRRGYKVITLSHLENGHSEDMSEEYPNLYWPFGAHILTGMKIVRNDPRLFAVYLTNHGCGPDSMLAHQAAEIMGTKPWLTLEVDEHYSPVGLVTRVEAFLASLQSHKTGSEGHRKNPEHLPSRFISGGLENLNRELPVFVPSLFPYSSLVGCRLRSQGFDCREMAATNMESLLLGRQTTRSKEYVTFTALIGDTVKCVTSNSQPHQLLLMQNRGAEADGQFSRTIRSHLDTIDRKDVIIVSPMLEKLYSDREIWLDFLAGDVIMSAPFEERSQILARILAEPVLDINTIVGYAKEIGRKKDTRTMLLLQGEPNCIFNDQLNGRVFSDLEKSHYLLRLPFSEYMAFLWKDSGIDTMTLEQEMQRVHDCLGQFSPFSESLDVLRGLSDKLIGKLAGANGRYRIAKSALPPAKSAAVIEVFPLYENVAAILNMVSTTVNKTPILRLAVNGEGHEIEKLETFIHFLQEGEYSDQQLRMLKN